MSPDNQATTEAEKFFEKMYGWGDPETLKKDLSAIIGNNNVSLDEETLEKYARDYSFVKARKPSCVIFVETQEQEKVYGPVFASMTI